MNESDNNNDPVETPEQIETTNEENKRKLKEYKQQNKKYKADIKEYQKYIDDIAAKSSDLFEKQLIYVAAGTMAGAVYFVEKFIPDVFNSYDNIYLLYSLALCGLTIIINLLSHYVGTKIYNIRSAKLTNGGLNEKRVWWSDRSMDAMNILSLASYFIGLFFLVIYIHTNFIKMSNKPTNPVDNTRGHTAKPMPAKPPVNIAQPKPTQTKSN